MDDPGRDARAARAPDRAERRLPAAARASSSAASRTSPPSSPRGFGPRVILLALAANLWLAGWWVRRARRRRRRAAPARLRLRRDPRRLPRRSGSTRRPSRSRRSARPRPGASTGSRTCSRRCCSLPALLGAGCSARGDRGRALAPRHRRRQPIRCGRRRARSSCSPAYATLVCGARRALDLARHRARGGGVVALGARARRPRRGARRLEPRHRGGRRRARRRARATSPTGSSSRPAGRFEAVGPAFAVLASLAVLVVVATRRPRRR